MEVLGSNKTQVVPVEETEHCVGGLLLSECNITKKLIAKTKSVISGEITDIEAVKIKEDPNSPSLAWVTLGRMLTHCHQCSFDCSPEVQRRKTHEFVEDEFGDAVEKNPLEYTGEIRIIFSP